MSSLTHCAEAERLDRCVSCGVEMQSYKCRCGYWVNECPACQKKKYESTMQRHRDEAAESIYRDIEQRALAKYEKP